MLIINECKTPYRKISKNIRLNPSMTSVIKVNFIKDFYKDILAYNKILDSKLLVDPTLGINFRTNLH